MIDLGDIITAREHDIQTDPQAEACRPCADASTYSVPPAAFSVSNALVRAGHRRAAVNGAGVDRSGTRNSFWRPRRFG